MIPTSTSSSFRSTRSASSTSPTGPATGARESPLPSKDHDATTSKDDDPDHDQQSRSEIVTQPMGSESKSSTIEGEVKNVDIPQLNVSSPTMMTQAPFRRRTHDFKVIPIPRKQQHDPEESFVFTLKLNIAFGFASTTTAANLYYCQPLLVYLAKHFNTNYTSVSTIPTVTQAGYATGILLISPLGDLVRRRPLLLLLITLSMLLTIGLALSPNVVAFKVLSYFLGVVTVTPQILLPYAADLAPAERRASVMSIVLSGLLLGIIIARAIGGLVADESGSWRNVYWVGVGLQGLALFSLWWVIPDRPSKAEIAMQQRQDATRADGNKAKRLTYAGILSTMVKFAVTEPVLIQGCIIGFAMQFVFSSFWVTLTFLLAESPYNFSTLKIGLFGLVGILGVLTAPFTGRLVDKLVLWVGIGVALGILLVSQVVLAIGAGLNLAAVIISCFLMDVGLQMAQVATTSKIYSIDPALRSRLNAVYVVSMFVGQVVGSAVGSKIFLSSGWRASAATSVGFGGFSLLALVVRGPHCSRYTWLGWEGGARFMKELPVVVPDEEKGSNATRRGSHPGLDQVPMQSLNSGDPAAQGKP